MDIQKNDSRGDLFKKYYVKPDALKHTPPTGGTVFVASAPALLAAMYELELKFMDPNEQVTDGVWLTTEGK
jgi:hypothetical protein